MKRGFTLVELMIVIAVIGIVVAIAIPTFINKQAQKESPVDMSCHRLKYNEEARGKISSIYICQGPRGVTCWVYDSNSMQCFLNSQLPVEQ